MEQPDSSLTVEAPKIQTTVIEPGRYGFITSMSEVWRFRELFLFLVWRDVSVRYKQTVLGVLWVVLQPLMAMIVFTAVFNRLAGIEAAGIPYPIFLLAGHIPWTFFAGSLNRSSESLVANTRLITKIYFPRLIIPSAAALAAAVDFAIALLVLAAFMVYYRHTPGVEILALPLLAALAFVIAVSVGMILSATNVRFRDVKFIVGFFLQMWMFATPVVYPYSDVAEKLAGYPILANLYLLNPMVGVIEGFRWSLLGQPFPAAPLLSSCLLAVVMFVIAQAYFRRVERTFADVI